MYQYRQRLRGVVSIYGGSAVGVNTNFHPPALLSLTIQMDKGAAPTTFFVTRIEDGGNRTDCRIGVIQSGEILAIPLSDLQSVRAETEDGRSAWATCILQIQDPK